MTTDELEAMFATGAVPCAGGLMLLRAEDAQMLIRQAADAGIAVLGIDGMFVSANATVSPIEHIADFSRARARGDGSWLEAERFITERRGLGLVFEVTLARHPNHAV